ncbi:hypothetical protein GIB67_025863 [Kingdonia uniflora]|uniref:Uncharacterized protein n=1 Tax=Kingdonia uniflora TaxID=39325 RepID=A0A7J7MD90_9MAGN|nr:hypothetical protein GIB67_025863 [Kingdonia uniflora]
MASAPILAAGRVIATPASPKVSPLRRTPICLTLQGGLLNASSLTRTKHWHPYLPNSGGNDPCWNLRTSASQLTALPTLDKLDVRVENKAVTYN